MKPTWGTPSICPVSWRTGPHSPQQHPSAPLESKWVPSTQRRPEAGRGARRAGLWADLQLSTAPGSFAPPRLVQPGDGGVPAETTCDKCGCRRGEAGCAQVLPVCLRPCPALASDCHHGMPLSNSSPWTESSGLLPRGWGRALPPGTGPPRASVSLPHRSRAPRWLLPFVCEQGAQHAPARPHVSSCLHLPCAPSSPIISSVGFLRL